MRNLVLLFVCTSMVSLQSIAQVIIWAEDFENNGNTANGGAGRYTSINDFHGGSNDYFGRVQGATKNYYLTNSPSGEQINSEVPYTNWNGEFFYAAEDLDDEGGTIGNPDGLDTKELIISNIDISGGSALRFKGLFAAGQNGPCGNSVYDGSDFVEIYYEIDGGGEFLGMCFNADLECNLPGDTANEPLYLDDDSSQGGACDGDGGGSTLLTAEFAEFFFLIPDGAELDLRIIMHMDSAREEFAFDNFEIEAEVLNNDEFSVDKNISIVPNPSNGLIEIKKNTQIDLKQAAVYDIAGKIIESFNFENVSASKVVDLSNLSSGVYFISIRTQDGSIITKKIVLY
ncbi:MAG: T9SS type A sorting domain-containing protein [Flavobacteriaceae bacterium]|nr:T9SS type A sorting domain-containing protein [Flavobacteriaceae bacterium]